MKFNNLTTLNIVRRDALLRTSDSPEILADYLTRYHKLDLTPEQAQSTFKGLETIRAKKAIKTAPELVEA